MCGAFDCVAKAQIKYLVICTVLPAELTGYPQIPRYRAARIWVSEANGGLREHADSLQAVLWGPQGRCWLRGAWYPVGAAVPGQRIRLHTPRESGVLDLAKSTMAAPLWAYVVLRCAAWTSWLVENAPLVVRPARDLALRCWLRVTAGGCPG